MAESTLTQCYVELMAAVAWFLYGKTELEALSTPQRAICDMCVQAGYRQFLYPPAVEGVKAGYEWSFLTQTEVITTSDGDADQDLPDNFGRLIGDGFTFAANAQVRPVFGDIGEGKIRKLRLRQDESGRPRVAGLRRVYTDGETDHKWEVMWYPKPDDAYPLEYRYAVLVDALTETSVFAWGGAKHSDTLTASCVAAADAKVNDRRDGDAFDDFARRLAGSVERDKAEGPKFYGSLSGGESASARGDNYTMTIGGVQIYPSE